MKSVSALPVELKFNEDVSISKDGITSLETGEFLAKETILFSPAFTKALWGDRMLKCVYCGIEQYPGHLHRNPCPYAANPVILPYQYHLQQAVISDDPLNYFYEHI